MGTAERTLAFVTAVKTTGVDNIHYIRSGFQNKRTTAWFWGAQMFDFFLHFWNNLNVFDYSDSFSARRLAKHNIEHQYTADIVVTVEMSTSMLESI